MNKSIIAKEIPIYKRRQIYIGSNKEVEDMNSFDLENILKVADVY